ncbi:hypothetical protein ACIQXF_04695 [Lysinibacillus sp. NPDC097231]|uniref:hypothetical protein n=1 Tax=Lysinibacillus sp. NPDC097231 TaxID=3364142 RepID=UPI0037FAC49D
MKIKDIFFWLSIGLIISVLVILTRQLLLSVPERFYLGSEIGEVLFNLSIGYFVTYWFYYLTVHRTEKIHKKKAYKLVFTRANKIVSNFNSLKQSMFDANLPIFQVAGIQMDNAYNYEQVLKFITPSTYSNSFNGAFQPMTWNERILEANNSIENAVKDIFIVIPYLDPDDIELFTDLYSCEYFELTNNIELTTIEDIEFLGKPMYEAYEIIKKIEMKFANR